MFLSFETLKHTCAVWDRLAVGPVFSVKIVFLLTTKPNKPPNKFRIITIVAWRVKCKSLSSLAHFDFLKHAGKPVWRKPRQTPYVITINHHYLWA